ncbi:hypothetical protein NFI96_028640 [Prochilodus magdalenae]|nr:hypothetical protein NFI96_028640 [Prochilodus magdalenae]
MNHLEAPTLRRPGTKAPARLLQQTPGV